MSNQAEAEPKARVHNPIWNFFHQEKVEGPSKVEKVLTLNEDQTVEDAITLFSKHHILSAPVLDPEDQSIVGMVDMLDIANFVLKVVPNDDEIEPGHLKELKMAGRAMAFKELKDVMGASGRDPPLPLNKHNPCSMAVSLFADGNHRAPVVDDDEKTILGYLSQSTLLRMLPEKIVRGKNKIMGAKSLKELGLGQGGVIMVPVTSKVLTLIRNLDQNSISAIGLTNKKGKLVGNFSITDLRGLWTDVWPTFVLSAEEYLAKHHVASLKPIMVDINEMSLIELVRMMADQKLHRVWAYEKGKLTGVISLTDLMRMFRDLELEV